MALQTYTRADIENLKTAPRKLVNGFMVPTLPPVNANQGSGVINGLPQNPGGSRQAPDNSTYIDKETGKTVRRPVTEDAYNKAVAAAASYTPPTTPRITPTTPVAPTTFLGAQKAGYTGDFSSWVAAGRPSGAVAGTGGTVPPPRISDYPDANNKVVKVGGKQDVSGAPTFSTDEEKNLYEDQITLKQVKGVALTDAENLYLIKKAREQSKVDTTQFDEVQKKIKEAQDKQDADIAAKKAEIEAEQDEVLASKKASNEARYERQLAEANKAGEKRGTATQNVISFSGFGRSTYAAEKQDEIQSDVNRHVESLQAARDAQNAIAEAEARGAIDKELEPLQKRANELADTAMQFQLTVAEKIADLNAKNKITGQQAVANLLKTLGAEIAGEVDKDASALVGFVADKNGKAILVNGKVMPIAKSSDAFDESLSKQLGYLVDKNRKPITDASGNQISYKNQKRSGGGGVESAAAASGTLTGPEEFALDIALDEDGNIDTDKFDDLSEENQRLFRSGYIKLQQMQLEQPQSEAEEDSDASFFSKLGLILNPASEGSILPSGSKTST